MGFFGWAGRALKRETRYLAGGEGISGWWQSVRSSWLSTKRRCPACGEGRMFPFTEPVDGIDRDFYGCSRCDHYEAADLSDGKDAVVADSLSRLRKIADSRIGGLSAEETAHLKSRLKSNSRFQYLFSLAFLATGVYLIFRTGSAWSLLNATALAALLFAHGLRSSYRYWQVCNNIFYQPGAFRRWLGLGQWLV